MPSLHIAPGLALPTDMVTEPIGILANRGRGKSYTTHALVEEIHDAGVPVVVLDVKGDWWGLRTSSDGKADGLPFYIFGGDHADLPLEPTTGQLLADLVVDERVSVVLDLSIMSKTKARSFTTAFAEQLYHRNRDPLFVVVDEADVLIPQRASAETARLLGAMEDIAKRGRGRGIGMAVVTQRPQEVAKSVLDLMDTLILLGMTGPRSLKSISDWISTHVDEETSAADVMATLPSLPVGTAWIWSPMQHLLERVKIRKIRTFDSHVTPKAGQTRTAPKGRAQLDLAALGERIAETIEKAKADDPRTLRTKIVELERLLAAEQAKPAPAPTVEYVEVPVLDPEIAAALHDALKPFGLVIARIEGAMSVLSDSKSVFAPGSNPAARGLIDRPLAGNQVSHGTPSSARRGHSSSSTPVRGAGAGSATTREKPSPVTPAGDAPRQAAGEALSKAQRLILTVLAQQGLRSTTQVAILTGYSHKSGGYRNALSQLRTSGYIDGRGTIAITDEGLAALGSYDPLPTGSALLDWWRDKHLSKAEKAIVDVLTDHDGGPVDVTTIAELAGYSAASGGFRNALSRLRSLELAAGRGELTLNPELVD